MRLKTQNRCQCRRSHPRLRVWKNLFLQEVCSIAACYTSRVSLVPMTGRHGAGKKSPLDGQGFLRSQTFYNLCVGLNSRGSWKVESSRKDTSVEQGWEVTGSAAPAASAVPLCGVTALQPRCPPRQPALLRGRSGRPFPFAIYPAAKISGAWVML